MTTHTPGPWKQDKVVGNMIWAGEMQVADIRGWGHLTGKGALGLSEGDAIDIQNANARLMAAAPDLLEALERLESFNQDIINGEFEHDPGFHLDVIKAALAKAKGE